MRLTDAVYFRLTTEPAAAALLGARVYPPKNVPQPAPSDPWASYFRVDQDEDFGVDGPTGFREVQVQIDCYAGTYDAVRDVADAARRALNGWRDLSVGVHCCRLVPHSEQDVREDEAPDLQGDVPARVSFDVLVQGEENP